MCVGYLGVSSKLKYAAQLIIVPEGAFRKNASLRVTCMSLWRTLSEFKFL